ncbi:MAG: hypothetical protein F7B11_05750 [Caldisphaeraceae archaeon]|nr:hypothetical protein [Caldisphaeraceae archaeon]
MKYCASVPYHITAIFSPRIHSDLLLSGSIGVGISVEPRLRFCLGYKGLKERLPYTAEKLLKKYGIMDNYTISMPLPIKMGYASSAASSIAVALTAFLMGKTSLMNALREAHKIEVESSTGLGDVLALSCGIGIVLRTKEGAPGLGTVDCTSFPGDIGILSIEFGEMNTQELLRKFEKYKEESEKRIKRIENNFNFETFSEEAMEFTESLNLLKAIGISKETIHKIPGVVSYFVKKKLLVIFVEKNSLLDARTYLREQKLSFKVLTPSSYGMEAWKV